MLVLWWGGKPATTSGQIVPENFANNAHGQHWKEIESAHFKIIFPARLAPLAGELVPQAEQIFEEYETRLGTAPVKRISLYLNDDDELVSGIRARSIETEYSIWKGDPFKKRIKPGDGTPIENLRLQIAYAFSEHIRYFPLDYWFYLFSRPKESPWSDGFVFYLAEPAKTLIDVSAERTITKDELTTPFWVDWTKAISGRSQIHYFERAFASDSLRQIYSYRQSLFGFISYFDFNSAFVSSAGISYDKFQKQWYERIINNRKRLKSQSSEKMPGQPVLQQKNTLAYIGAAVNYNGQLIANLKYRSTGNELEQLQVDKTKNRKSAGRIISEGYFHPAMDWHPMRNELLFSKQYYNDKQGTYGYRLYIWNSESNDFKQLTKDQNALFPSFSPSGSHFVYVEKTPAQNIIWLQNTENGLREDIAAFARPINISYLDYNPVCDELLISYYEDGIHKSGIFDIESKIFMPLSAEGRSSLHAQWGGDGKRIYFNGKANGVPNIIRAEYSGTSLVNIETVAATYSGALLLDAASDSSSSYLLTSELGISQADKISKIRISDLQALPQAAGTGMENTEKKDNGQQSILNERSKDAAQDLRVQSYNAFSNIKWEQPIALPYVAKYGDFGLAAYLELKEPLRTHEFEYYGTISFADPLHQSYFYSSYANNSLKPRIELKFNQFPSASGFLGKSRKAKTVNSLSLSSLWKMNALSHDYSNWYAGLTLRYMAFDYFPESSLRLHNPNIYFNNRYTRQTDLTGTLVWRSLKPNSHALIHPPDGEGARLWMTASRPILGSQTRHARFGLEGYTILPAFGNHRIYLYGSGVTDTGNPAGRDFLSFSDNGDYQLPGPDFLASVNPGVSRFVRGYSSSLVGDRFLFGRAEYRIPFQFNTTEKLLGLLPPARTSFTVYGDGGIMGGARITSDYKTSRYRYSIGAEIKRVFSFGGSFELTYELGIAQPLNRSLAPKAYFNLRSALPF